VGLAIEVVKTASKRAVANTTGAKIGVKPAIGDKSRRFYRAQNPQDVNRVVICPILVAAVQALVMNIVLRSGRFTFTCSSK